MRTLAILVVAVLAVLGGWWAYEQFDGQPAIVAEPATPAPEMEAEPTAPVVAAEPAAAPTTPAPAQPVTSAAIQADPYAVAAAPEPVEAAPAAAAVVRAEDVADVQAAYNPLEIQPFDVVLGDPAAPVTIIEYSSLTCPHCAAFHNETLPKLKETVIADGTAKLVVREFPLDRIALYGAVLARCVDPERFHPVVETMFKTQATWARASDPVAALNNIARLAGLPPERIEECAASERLQQFVANNRLQGEQLNIRATPTFFVNGEKVEGAQPYEDFVRVIERVAP